MGLLIGNAKVSFREGVSFLGEVWFLSFWRGGFGCLVTYRTDYS